MQTGYCVLSLVVLGVRIPCAHPDKVNCGFQIAKLGEETIYTCELCNKETAIKIYYLEAGKKKKKLFSLLHWLCKVIKWQSPAEKSGVKSKN